MMSPEDIIMTNVDALTKSTYLSHEMGSWEYPPPGLVRAGWKEVADRPAETDLPWLIPCQP